MQYIQQIFSENFCNLNGLMEMSLRFFFNFAIVWFIVHVFYSPKGRRRDDYST